MENSEEFNSQLVGVHCTAHHLALPTGDAVKSVQQVKTFQQDFLSNPAVRSNKLHELQNQLDEHEPQLMFTQQHTVRWLSIHNQWCEDQ